GSARPCWASILPRRGVRPSAWALRGLTGTAYWSLSEPRAMPDKNAIDWSKLSIGMLGGDRREQEIARRAAATGADVRASGFPWPVDGIPGVQHLVDPAAVLEGARFALFPIPGIAASGALFAPAASAPIIPDRAM